MRLHNTLFAFVLCTIFCASAYTQETEKSQQESAKTEAEEYILRVTPDKLLLPIGKSAELEGEVVDAGGRPVEAQIFFFSRSRRKVAVTREGKVTAKQPGEHTVMARAVLKGGDRRRGPSAKITVTIPFPELDKIRFSGAGNMMHTGTTARLVSEVIDTSGLTRDDLKTEMTSSDSAIVEIDENGFITAIAPGECSIKSTHEKLTATHKVRVVKNPVARVELTTETTAVKTGDVVTFKATLKNAAGENVTDVPVHYTFQAAPDDDLGQGASGIIQQDGRFVAETPGLYTVVATCGTASARKSIRAEKRFRQQSKIRVVGRGKVLDTHTSDLWVWEGEDGRDYAVTGTWGANGDAHFWDVTEPAKIKRIATVNVDARTVNDVKVSENGKVCVLSREGASNRKNGIVILDVSDPTNPVRITEFDEDLTGGVHNVFIDGNYIYALSASRRYDVIDIEDPKNPKKVGSYQIFEPGSAIHDVWVKNGIAYSSNWRHGVHMVDVGYGDGSPEKPKKIASYAYPNGWNHAAFPYTDTQTGKQWVVAGDEAFPYGLSVKDKPTYPRGWLHFIDFSDLKNPKESARYQVPEAGTHNLWIDGDTLYAAYYNGGLRVVDISGDLMGDLYKQGREIAWFLPTDKDGVVPNAPMVWGPQPHKGHIFFSDWNTGLWAVKLISGGGR